jgi:hypothetical protein
MARSSVYASNVKRQVAKNRQIRAIYPLHDPEDQPGRVSGPESVLGLQRLAGNAAVTALIHRQTLPIVGKEMRTRGPVAGGLVQRCPGCGGTCGGSNHEDDVQRAVLLEPEADEDDEWASGRDGSGSGDGSEWMDGGGTTALASGDSDGSGAGSHWSAGPSTDGSSAGSEWSTGPSADGAPTVSGSATGTDEAKQNSDGSAASAQSWSSRMCDLIPIGTCSPCVPWFASSTGFRKWCHQQVCGNLGCADNCVPKDCVPFT